MNSKRKEKLASQKTSGRTSNSKETKTNKKISKPTKSKTNKKIWSVKALIESMKPSIEELKYREEKLKEINILQKSSALFKCTKCLTNFNDLIKKHKKVPIHPVLGVLMCIKCCNYYEDGEFSLDSDGEDKYCRWCGEGGTIFSCAKCICGFCASCVKRHFNLDFFKKVQKDDNWLCFFCDPKPLWFLRFICSQAINTSKGVNNSSSNLSTCKGFEDNNGQSSSPNNLSSSCLSERKRNSFRKRIFTSSSDESEPEMQEILQKKLKLASSSPSTSSKERETESLQNIKFNALIEIEKVLKLSEYQLKFGANWSNKVLTKLGSSEFLSTKKNLANECKKIKWFLSLLSTYLVQYCNSLNSIEQTLLKEDETKISSNVPDKNESPYISILQFLRFVNSQIKTFMEKGINLTDLLEAEVYDDENIIGIKKKLNSLSSSVIEKNIDLVEKINFTFSTNDKIENNEGTEEQKPDNENSECNAGTDEEKIDSESRDKVENELDLTGDQNSEINSPEYDKDSSSVNAAFGMNVKGSDTEEDIQEILAILENA